MRRFQTPRLIWVRIPVGVYTQSGAVAPQALRERVSTIAVESESGQTMQDEVIGSLAASEAVRRGSSPWPAITDIVSARHP